jgi:hypothetical protein
MSCLSAMTVLLNLVFELKLLNVLMGREGPEEFNIWSACFVLLCSFVLSFLGVDSAFCEFV